MEGGRGSKPCCLHSTNTREVAALRAKESKMRPYAHPARFSGQKVGGELCSRNWRVFQVCVCHLSSTRAENMNRTHKTLKAVKSNEIFGCLMIKLLDVVSAWDFPHETRYRPHNPLGWMLLLQQHRAVVVVVLMKVSSPQLKGLVPP